MQMPFLLKDVNGTTVQTLLYSRQHPPKRIDVLGVGVIFGPAEGWTGGGYSLVWEDPPPAAPPTRAEKIAGIVAERGRRLQAGFDYDFGNGRGVHRIGTTEADMAGWREVTDLANALIATGSGSTTINVLTDTGAVAVTATEWAGILIAAAQFRQPIWAASFALQALDPLPDDYTAEEHWVSP
jgi:hypothetical protein